MVFAQFLAAFLALPVVRAAIPSIPGFSLTWSDDFIGETNSLPNPSNWIVNTGIGYPGGPDNWGTGEIQVYTSKPANLKLSGNGALLITALRDDSGGWTSARMESQRTDFVASPGGKMRIQASLNLPDLGSNGIGYWPAFWTLGKPYRGNYANWPAIGEFDILENVNGLDRVFAAMHCGTNPGGPCNETTGLVGSRQCPNSPCQGNFHTYTLEVDRTQALEVVRWSVDGEQFWQVTSSDLPSDVWAQSVHGSHFILINLAMGGAFPDGNYGGKTPLASTTPGGTFQAEYIAVYNS